MQGASHLIVVAICFTASGTTQGGKVARPGEAIEGEANMRHLTGITVVLCLATAVQAESF
jgi:hypothetical protein